MTAFVSHTTVGFHNAYELSEWWTQVLGYVDIEDDEFCVLRSEAERGAS